MIHISLDDRVAAALRAKAELEGLTIAAYLESIALAAPAQPLGPMSPEEFDRFLDEEATDGPSPIGTFSRAELYPDHD